MTFSFFRFYMEFNKKKRRVSQKMQEDLYFLDHGVGFVQS